MDDVSSRSNSRREPERRALLENNQTLNRYIATGMGPLVDIVFFCALIGNGQSLRSSHIASFTVAMALNYLLKVRSAIVAGKRTRDWRLHCHLLMAALLALFLRGGVLGL